MGRPSQRAKIVKDDTVCSECNRKLLPGSLCPFCNPQHADRTDSNITIQQRLHWPAGRLDASGVPAARRMAERHAAAGFLHVSMGQNKGLTLLLGKTPVRIGRKTANALALNDPGVSSQHCEIRPVKDGFEILDSGSKNGTFVNQRRLDAPQVLVNGDIIVVGATRIHVGIS